MRANKLLLYTLIVLTFCSCSKKFYRAKGSQQIATVNNNVCKKLVGKVVLYAIFVDSRYTHPWTAYDISSTLDSVRKAMTWVTTKAKENNVDVSIEITFHQKDNTIPIAQNLSENSLYETLFADGIIDGIDNLNFWANSVAKKAGLSFPKDTSSIAETKNEITNRERLIARLRNINSTDNVVIMYFLNSYHQDDISLAMFTGSSEETEFSIVTFKQPAVIAHEFLHIFGALDLYMSPFDKKKRALKSKLKIMEYYPKEIMAFTDRSIEKLDISPLTKYLIGWTPELDDKAKTLLFGKKMKIYKY
jgi:hypothetical protein